MLEQVAQRGAPALKTSQVRLDGALGKLKMSEVEDVPANCRGIGLDDL